MSNTYHYRHDTNTFITLNCQFLKSLRVSKCQCQCHVWCLSVFHRFGGCLINCFIYLCKFSFWNLRWFFQIRRFFHTSTYWDGIQLEAMQRNLICIFTKLWVCFIVVLCLNLTTTVIVFYFRALEPVLLFIVCSFLHWGTLLYIVFVLYFLLILSYW